MDMVAIHIDQFLHIFLCDLDYIHYDTRIDVHKLMDNLVKYLNRGEMNH